VEFGPNKIWKRVSGSTAEDLTLTPSILLSSTCNFHGHIINGVVSWMAAAEIRVDNKLKQ
jgi:hypothetical protein